MHTLGNKTKRIARKEESWAINEAFTCKVAVPKGAIVKLDSATGEVEPVEAVTDVPFGVVTVGCNAGGEEVTIQTQYNGLYRGLASGTIELGDTLKAEELDSTTSLMKYAKGTTGIITAHALSDAADGEEVWVGTLRVFPKL